MPALIALSTLIQIACIVHVLRTERDRTWIWIILFFPMLGSAFYFFTELLPEMRRTRAGKQLTKQILKTIDPERDLRKKAKELALTDNVDNKIQLADELIQHFQYEEAIELYKTCLQGLYKQEPNIMLKLAQAYFLAQNYVEAKNLLDELIATNPDFRSQEGHLLYARTLEALEQMTAAQEEYRVLASYYSGLEAKCRYALLLKRLGHTEESQRVFHELIHHAEKMPLNFQKVHKQWLDIARSHLSPPSPAV